jgi:glutamyl-tRNA synthetase
MTVAAHTVPTGRLAPSPTGKMHLGHARTFLLAWWQARSRGGRAVLRIEDLDAPRVVPGATDGILRDLEWLGMDWDGPVVIQSTRLERIQNATESLLARGLAYPCVCSRGDLRLSQSAPQDGDVEPRYPGTCRGRFSSVEEAERVSGKPCGVRFIARPGTVSLVDGFRGPYETDVAATIGDFLIARRSGAPAYQLAVVVDDAEDGVTEVVRGDDLLPSTARQYLLREALGLSHPVHFHVPLVVDAEGRRLAKRRDDLSLFELRERGVDPRAVVGWAARTAGLTGADRVTAREVSPQFSMENVPRTEIFADQAVRALLGDP